MICFNCGQELKDGANICRNCGTRFSVKKAVKLPLPVIPIILSVIGIVGIWVGIQSYNGRYSSERISQICIDCSMMLLYASLIIALILQNKQKSLLGLIAGLIPCVFLTIARVIGIVERIRDYY